GSFSMSRDLSINSSSTIDVTAANRLTLNGVASGSAALHKSGPGTLRIAMAGTYSGPVIVDADGGKLSLAGGSSALPNVNSYTVTVGGTLEMDKSTMAGGAVPGHNVGGPNLHLAGGTFAVVGSPSTSV